MTDNNDVEAICVWTYQVDPDRETEFRTLLADHWPTLRRLRLVTAEPARILRSIDTEPLTYVELFSWGPEGMRPAHDQPEVAALWAKLAGCVQPRQVHQNVPGMSFPLYTEVTLGDG